MKLLMENWRRYQLELLTEGKILDALQAGFKKLMDLPSEFDAMVEETKENFRAIFTEKLEDLAQSAEMQEVGQQVAAAVNKNATTLQEAVEGGTDPRRFFSIEELKKMGVGQETIELIATSVAGHGATALIEAAEQTVGKAVPPAIKDWFVRFASKFIGSFIFGFIDNFIMVIAGSFIDKGIAVMLGGAGGAMFAAGLGNTISDVVGQLGSEKIESTMNAMGLDVQAVSDEQMKEAPSWMRFLDKNAGVIGIALGCLVGLFPLAFLEEDQE